jgi:hypothetical protein
MELSRRTSGTHPLRVAEIAVDGGGHVGVTFCPGKHQDVAMTGAWARSLDLDLRGIREWGARVIVTLVTDAELRSLKVEGMGAAVAQLGISWLHLPIEDVSTPTAEWEQGWSEQRGLVHQVLDDAGRVLVHCKGGLGRAGLVAARILVERGAAPMDAISLVRRVRPGAIQTIRQEAYVRSLGALL